MPRLFYGNFHFETELRTGLPVAEPSGGRDSRLRRGAWLAMAESGDLVIGPDERPYQVEEISEGSDSPHVSLQQFSRTPGRRYEFVPWGWSFQATRAGRSFGCRVIAPTLEVVAKVNQRSFRANLERELGVAPEGLAIARSLDEVADGIDRVLSTGTNSEGREFDWILKAEYGMAGREAIRGRGRLTDPRAVGWCRKRIGQSWPIIVEPWLASAGEGSLHFEIPLEGPVRHVGTTVLRSDGTGTYRSSLLGDHGTNARLEEGLETGLKVAGFLQRHGYWGPLGLDVMLVVKEGQLRLRPLQDLNARWTMGRLALEWWQRRGGPPMCEWSPPVTWPMAR